MTTLEFKWGTSRGRDTYGYKICSLYADGRKVASCNGGGYDMQGTCLGDWIAKTYADRLKSLKARQFPKQNGVRRGFYGLSYHNPNFDVGAAKVAGETIKEREAAGKTVGLERYQAIISASSPIPTKKHTIPSIDGACGTSSVEAIARAIGLSITRIPTRAIKIDIYQVTDTENGR